MYELDQRDWKIINFIQEHPRSSKADVVRMMKDEASRMTVFNKLDKLEFEEYIIARRDKPNSQIYKLFVNENNLLVTETHQLVILRKALSGLMNVMETKKMEMDNLWDRNLPPGGLRESLRSYNLMLSIYSTLISLYTAKSILEWPSKINDEQVLRNLYETVFMQLFDIQKTISGGIHQNFGAELTQSMIEERVLSSDYLLLPYHLSFFVSVFERFKMLDAVTPVIDSLWKLSSPFLGVIKQKIKSWEKRHPQLWKGWEKEEISGNWKELVRIWQLMMDSENPYNRYTRKGP